MNIIETHKEGNTLEVKVHRTFNLTSKNMLENRIHSDTRHLNIDLSDCWLVDSEGVIFMYNWQRTGNTLELINPPKIFFDILDLLELRKNWNLNIIETP